jgi:hypothetical protein
VSYWGVHIGVAGIVTAVVLLLVQPGWRYRGIVILASGCWAVIPDFHHALDAYPGLQASWKAVLHESVLTNLFWAHRWIDQADPGDSVPLSRAMWVVFFVVLVVTELLGRRYRDRKVGDTEIPPSHD